MLFNVVVATNEIYCVRMRGIYLMPLSAAILPFSREREMDGLLKRKKICSTLFFRHGNMNLILYTHIFPSLILLFFLLRSCMCLRAYENRRRRRHMDVEHEKNILSDINYKLKTQSECSSHISALI
jgi:hypothetical protein